MKKVTNTESSTVNVNEIKQHKFYGVLFTTERGFITREKYCGGDYTVRCINGLTYGNGWGNHTDKDLSMLVDKLISRSITVYEFETARELFDWLLGSKTNLH